MKDVNSFSTGALGQIYEKKAEAYLIEQGLKLVVRNFRCKLGEIDLIMQDQQKLVFVEVRFRTSNDFGGSAASVSRGKQKHIIRTAQYFLKCTYVNRPPMCRFDVVALKGDNIKWIKNAFYSF